MAYQQKSINELKESIINQSSSLGRQSQAGQEIIGAQKQLSSNRLQQSIEMNSYVNRYRRTMGQQSRVGVQRQSTGQTGGTALYNNQSAAMELGNNLAETQTNYNEFVDNATTQGDEYNQQMKKVEEVAQGDVAEQEMANEKSEKLKKANNIVQTAALAGSAIVALIPFVGWGAAGITMATSAALGGISGAISGGLGAAANDSENGWGIALGTIAGGTIGAGLGAIGGKGAGNAVGKTIEGAVQPATSAAKTALSTAGKEIAEKSTKEMAEMAGKEAIESWGTNTISESGELIKQSGALSKVGTDVVDNTIAGHPKSVLDSSLNKMNINFNKGMEELTSTDGFKVYVKQAKKINPNITDEALIQAYTENASNITLNGVEEIKTLAAGKNLREGTLEYNQFVSKEMSKLENKVSGVQMFNGIKQSWKNDILKPQINGLVNRVVSKFNPKLATPRMSAGFKWQNSTGVGKAGILAGKGLKGGALYGANFAGQSFVNSSINKRSINSQTKERYGALFEQIGRKDLKDKYGY